MKITCEKCGVEGSDKDKIWVFSMPLHGYGETPKLCGKCHDKVFDLIRDCFKKWIKKDNL